MNSIQFTCLQCGECCKVGFIYLKKGEAEKIASHLNLSLREFKKQHTRYLFLQGRVMKWDDNSACPFIKDNKCGIYEARPSQCATWPYWTRLEQSEYELNRAKEYCKGIK